MILLHSVTNNLKSTKPPKEILNNIIQDSDSDSDIFPQQEYN